MDQHKLSEGSLRIIMNGGDVNNPIMQVLSYRKITSGKPGDSERYRLLLSDGKNFISFVMLSTQLNAKVESGGVPNFSIIKINRHVTSVLNNTGSKEKRVLVILDMDLLTSGEQVGGKIGNPEQLSDTGTESTPTTNGNAASSSVSHSSNEPAKPTYTKPPVMSNSNMDTTLNGQMTNPIASLSPYNNKWIIKARVMTKSPIRTWSNSRGEGKLFSMDLVDDTGEIRATGFRDLVDKYYEFIEVDKVYFISKCQLKLANKQYSTLKNDYEMTLTNETVIQECHEVDDSIPQTKYNFTTIDKIAQTEVGTFIDVIGVAKSSSDVVTFQAKSSGRELKKREVQLVDQSNNAISLTLWGSEAESFNGSAQPIVALKGAKVGEFGGGKNLSTISNTIIKVNPDLPESHRLRGWFDNGGMSMESTNISARTGGGFQTNWMSIREVQDSGLGNSERGDYYQIKGTVLLFRHENCLYKACPTDECNKKVVDMENGMYRCEKCNREYPNFKYRLLASMNLGDWSGSQWVSTFSTEAEKILGMTSQEVGQAIENDSEALVNITSNAHFKQFIFRCRAKIETYNDESRLKTVAVKVEDIDYKSYNQYLISKIQQFNS